MGHTHYITAIFFGYNNQCFHNMWDNIQILLQDYTRFWDCSEENRFGFTCIAKHPISN